MKDVCLVIPTIRENCFRDFFARWDAVGLFGQVDLLVVEDNPTRTFTVPKDLNACHVSWAEIGEDLGENSWVIPRRSDTVRSYGYLLAYQQDYSYIMTLDDDCYPCTDEDGLRYDGEGFVREHIRNLTERSRWFNTLNSVKPRGIPFYNVGKNGTVMVNHGLWTNVLDYDAPYQLANPVKEKFSYDNRVVPAGQYFPMCGMNVMWRREATVLMYHLLMGQWVGPYTPKTLCKLPFDRFGDIWCGIFMKKVLDLGGYQVSTGMPYIRHERASNPFANLKKEANGLEVNERLWEYVDRFSNTRFHPSNFSAIYSALGEHVARYDEFPEYVEYFSSLGLAMQTWARLFGDV